jgi:hypothetical protein
MSPPRIAATAVFLRGARTISVFDKKALAVFPVPLRSYVVVLLDVLDAGSWAVGWAEGAGTVNRALSWTSVSRIRAVISCGCSRAFVKILGGGNLWDDQSIYTLVDALFGLTEDRVLPLRIGRFAQGGSEVES